MIILLFFAACNNTSTEQKSDDQVEESAPLEGEIRVAVIDVTGMHCESCEKTIKEVLSAIEGVEAAKVSLEYNQAKVKFEPVVISTDELKDAIEEKGYGVTNIEVISMESRASESGK